MSSGGIGIQITRAVEHPIRARRTFAWPPHITRRNVHAGFEGLPARIGVYQGQTRVGTREVFVFVVFGRAVPTRRQLNRANTELQKARVA
jgi:hypothetical protein